MDRAKTLKDGREITVFAHDLSSKGRKRVTHGARFKCPYCGRPVDLAALDSTKVTTYFKHHRNDELAKFCDEYVSSNGSGNLLMRNPVVPIFLDLEGESTKRYVLKTGLYGIGKRLRSDLKKTTEAYMSVNGRTYPLWQMAAESLRIPIRKLPTLELSNEITVMAPESIRRRIGEAEDCRSGMVFTSDYDSAPPNHANHIGIRIRRGNDVYVGRRYYLVIDSREPKLSKSVATSFDTAKKVGVLTANSCFTVWRVSVAASSSKRETAANMFAHFGCRLTDKERTVDLLWSPSLTSNGIDQPLFENTSVIYHEPEGTGSHKDNGTVQLTHPAEIYALGDDYISPFGYIGTGKHERPIYELDTGFLVSRPDEFHTWRMISQDQIDLSAFSASECDETSVILASDDKPNLTCSFPVNVEIRSRTGNVQTESLLTSEETLPTKRKDLVLVASARKAFPRSFLLCVNNADMTVKSASCPVTGLDSKSRLREVSHGMSIAMRRAGITTRENSASKNKILIQARRGE